MPIIELLFKYDPVLQELISEGKRTEKSECENSKLIHKNLIHKSQKVDTKPNKSSQLYSIIQTLPKM